MVKNTPLSKVEILAELPVNVKAKLRTGLKESQLRKVLKMYRKKVQLPLHLLNTDPLTIIPPKGAHPALSTALRKKGGRNHHGKITCRHRGGGFKRRIRVLDRSRSAPGSYRVVRIEHDPNRSAKLALMQETTTKQCSYWLAWDGIEPEQVVKCGQSQNGNVHAAGMNLGILQLPGTTHLLRDIALGTTIYNIELTPGKGGQLCRSAGCKATLVGKDPDGKHCSIKLPSDKIRKVRMACRASIGVVSNPTWHLRIVGKAGRTRNLGIRPTVRGVAMNARDHPHGGGKGGKSKGKPSQSPWGKICK